MAGSEGNGAQGLRGSPKTPQSPRLPFPGTRRFLCGDFSLSNFRASQRPSRESGRSEPRVSPARLLRSQETGRAATRVLRERPLFRGSRRPACLAHAPSSAPRGRRGREFSPQLAGEETEAAECDSQVRSPGQARGGAGAPTPDAAPGRPGSTRPRFLSALSRYDFPPRS